MDIKKFFKLKKMIKNIFINKNKDMNKNMEIFVIIVILLISCCFCVCLYSCIRTCSDVAETKVINPIINKV